MNKSVIEDITLLENISKSILEEYDRLYILELSKVDNKEYRKVLEEIKRLIILEDSVIERITSNPNIDEILEYVAHKYNINVSVNIGVCLNKQDLLKARIMNSLLNEVLDNDKSSLDKQFVPRFYVDLLKLALSIYEKSNLFKGFNFNKRIKYNTAYLFKSIENELINAEFLVPEHPYLTYKLLGIDIDTYEKINDIVDGECLKMISLFVEVLAKTTLNDKYNEELMCDKEFLSCLLRGCFVLMDEKYREKVRVATYPLLVSLKDEPSMKLGYNLLDIAVNNVKIDREIPQIVSFCR